MYFERHVFVCENKREGGRECCAEKNSKELRGLLKERAKVALREARPGARIRINGAGCLDRCEEGPTVVVYPEGEWFRLKNAEDIERFIEHYLVAGDMAAIADLQLPKEHPAVRRKQAGA